MKQLPSYEEAKAMRNNSNQNSSLLGRLGGALIHLLGGHTSQELRESNQKSLDRGYNYACEDFKHFADQMNGMPADDWCKLMYSHICGSIKRLESSTTVPDGSPSGNTEESHD